MIFKSYAQNFEDVMLWRALKHVPAGRYVDIGAQHPIYDSVSKGFYEQGWRGIHVEPVPTYAEQLRADRPDELVLQLALSDTEGVLPLYVIPDTGLSTGDKALAEKHKLEHNYNYNQIEVPMITMKAALASSVGQQIHWMKIDVEGFEEDVLRGWDSTVIRPWIIVVEVVVPLSTEVRQAGPDQLLVDAGYRFAYFDGLNRFYVAQEHPELLPAFSAPPNVFDDIDLSGFGAGWCRGLVARNRELAERVAAFEQELDRVKTDAAERIRQAEARMLSTSRNLTAAEKRAARAERRAASANLRAANAETESTTVRGELTGLRTRADESDARVARAETQAETAARDLYYVRASNSWRVTAPIRFMSTAVRSVVRGAGSGVSRHPRLKGALVKLIDKSPPLRRKLETMLAPPPEASNATVAPPLDLKELSPRAQEIYRQMKLAMEESGS